MSHPDTIWWCENHETGPCVPHDDEPAHCFIGHAMNGSDLCRMIQRRLVSPTALVIERDEDGEWHRSAVAGLEPYMPSNRLHLRLEQAIITLDALAASQKDNPPPTR